MHQGSIQKSTLTNVHLYMFLWPNVQGQHLEQLATNGSINFRAYQTGRAPVTSTVTTTPGMITNSRIYTKTVGASSSTSMSARAAPLRAISRPELTSTTIKSGNTRWLAMLQSASLALVQC